MQHGMTTVWLLQDIAECSRHDQKYLSRNADCQRAAWAVCRPRSATNSGKFQLRCWAASH